MTTTPLQFDKVGSSWETTFVSQGRAIIQVEQSPYGIVSVLSRLGDNMPASVVGVFSNPYGGPVLFGVELPIGMSVIVRSGTEVKNANLAWDE